jgi:cytosine/adenosine deaminase-related metal-dependent hydrolase
VHGTDAVFDALEPTGIRATVGKCLMDDADDPPARLHQPWQAAIDESLAIHRRWHGAGGGRLRAALAPRFAISCSRELLEATAAVSIQREEIALVRARTGLDNIAYLASLGLASERLCAAHCVWVTETERRILADHAVKVLHCPGSNLKLGSGIAPVRDMRAMGIDVSIGADGAACNNALDMFQEMRLAATLQAMAHGPGALPARDVVWMATRGGARALGLEKEIGSLEPGKLADVIIVGARDVHHVPGDDPYSTLVYACRPSDVHATIVDGRVVYDAGRLSWGDRDAMAFEASRAREVLRARSGI